MKVTVNRKQYLINPDSAIGKGGEADVYKISGGLALKIFKAPDHPDLAGQPEEQNKAAFRLREQQSKLPQFPREFGEEVVSPMDLALQSGKIVGYTMRLIEGAEPIMMYAKRNFRSQGVPESAVAEIFRGLRGGLIKIHGKDAVIGDFNDLNILVKGNKPYFIDTDSWQFRGYWARAYTVKFLDPMAAEIKDNHLSLARPYNRETDWYAYAIMYFQSLLFVDPYGGIYRPKKKSDRIIESLRPLKRITVFNPEVRYPKPARHFKILPDDLLNYFEEIFTRDKREVFSENYFNLEWKTCKKCGLDYARSTCPDCVGAPDMAVKEKITVRGQVKINSVFKTGGILLFAAFQNGLKWLEYSNGGYFRENKKKILSGPLLPGVRYRLQGPNTLLGQGGQLITVGPEGDVKKQAVDALNNLSVFDVNKRNIFFLLRGNIYRQNEWAPERIGEALPNQTLFWTGEKIGFGFYRAGLMSEAFLFPVGGRCLTYIKNFHFPPGQITDSTCFLADSCAWFLISLRHNGKTENHCFLYAVNGELAGQARGEENDGSWLGEIRGKIAIGSFLLSATDDGIVKVGNQNGRLEAVKTFPDTERFVQSDSHILAGDGGLYIVGSKTINHLALI